MKQDTEKVAQQARRIYEERLRASLEQSHLDEFVAINRFPAITSWAER